MAIQRIWRARGPLKKTPEEISAQARPRGPQSHYLGTVSENQRGYQGSRRFRAAGRRRSSSGCPQSGPSRKNAAPLPVRSSPHAFSSISPAAASRYAIWSGKPTTAASSKEIFPTGSWMPLLENVKDNYAHRNGGKTTEGHSRAKYELPCAS
jgi:hypothetical protein